MQSPSPLLGTSPSSVTAHSQEASSLTFPWFNTISIIYSSCLSFLSKPLLLLSCPFLHRYRYNSLLSSCWAWLVFAGRIPHTRTLILEGPKRLGSSSAKKPYPLRLIIFTERHPPHSNHEMFLLRQIISDSSLFILRVEVWDDFLFSSILENLDDGPYMQPHALECPSVIFLHQSVLFPNPHCFCEQRVPLPA